LEPQDAKARVLLIDSNYPGIKYLLSAYSDMGSFNKLLLGQNTNEASYAWASGHIGINDNLQELRDRVTN
jgi:hypothetical protein